VFSVRGQRILNWRQELSQSASYRNLIASRNCAVHPTREQSSQPIPEYAIPRERMVERLREHYGIRDERVLEAMRTVPRHAFVPEALQSRAYGDHALPISANQTISQPFIVAHMTELIERDRDSRVLEIGAGSGYQTAVLARIAAQVYAIE